MSADTENPVRARADHAQTMVTARAAKTVITPTTSGLIRVRSQVVADTSDEWVSSNADCMFDSLFAFALPSVGGLLDSYVQSPCPDCTRMLREVTAPAGPNQPPRVRSRRLAAAGAAPTGCGLRQASARPAVRRTRYAPSGIGDPADGSPWLVAALAGPSVVSSDLTGRTLTVTWSAGLMASGRSI